MNKRYVYIADKLAKLGIKKGSVLDCGCGEGHGSKIFKDRGFSVQGIDLSPSQVKKTKKKHVIAEEGSITNLSCNDDQFDIFICSETLEHLTREESALAAKEIDRVCKNTGYICITVPWDKKICLSKPGHKQYLSHNDIISLFPTWSVKFKGKFCKNPRRCNRVVIFRKG